MNPLSNEKKSAFHPAGWLKPLLLTAVLALTRQAAAETAGHAHPHAIEEPPAKTIDHSRMDHGSMDHGSGTPAREGRDPDAYSDGYRLDSGPYLLEGRQHAHMADSHNFGALRIDRLERVYGRDDNATAYDAQAWWGGTYDRLWLKAEGERSRDRLQEARSELLWSHAVAPFWDRQLGLRHDSGAGPERQWLALGLHGLAPYWFELDVAAYLGSGGRSALRLGSEYELLLTQRAILQPRVEFNLYGQDDPARGLGSGLAEGVLGLRLRYEFSRQLAPYLGVEWSGKFGQSADLAHSAGDATSEWRWVGGVRFWF
jgi:copper resistance protein B